MTILIDPPSHFAPAAEWQAFLAEMETIALAKTEDADLVRYYIKLAKAQLGLSEPARRFKCPECKLKAGVNIDYGYPSEELFEQAQRNEAVLGGCAQTIYDPDRQCLDCGHQWSKQTRKGNGDAQ